MNHDAPSDSLPGEIGHLGPRRSALVLCLGVVLVVGGVQLWLSFFAGEDGRDETAAIEPGAAIFQDHRDVVLTSPYGLRRAELIALLVLLAVRMVVAWRPAASRFEPVLDLPLIGVALAASGAGDSPLDPALPLAYLALMILLRKEGDEARPRAGFVIRLVVGFVLVFAITSHHDRDRLASNQAALPARFEEDVGKLHARFEERIRAVDAEATAAFRDSAQSDLPAVLGGLQGPVAQARDALVRFRDGLLVCDALSELETLLEEQHDAEKDCVPRWERAFQVWRDWQSADGADPSSRPRTTVDAVNDLTGAWIKAHELFASIELHGRRLVEETKGTEAYAALLERRVLSADVRRGIQIPALLGFALLVMAAADRLRAAARAAQEQQSRAARAAQEQEHRRELERREQEKQNWIALTAGLTHGLGNDILAYDIYLREILEELEPRGEEEMAARLRFLRDSNRGRMGFLQFLEAFAEQRKAKGEGRRPSFPHQDVELAPLLRRVREHLAAVETADLPPRGTDPAVDRQLDRLQELELEVSADTEDAGVLRRAHRGVVDFCAYELLKNALRNCSGRRPLEARLHRDGPAVVLRLINDVEVEEKAGRCGSCGAASLNVMRVRRRRDQPAACADCFPERLLSLLESSFEPGQGGGTGLGLFLIRYFLSAYYGGSIRTAVVDPAIPTVEFELRLPDDPAQLGVTLEGPPRATAATDD